MRCRLFSASVAIAASACACNDLVGDGSVFLWSPDAGSLDAGTPGSAPVDDAGLPTGIAREVVSNWAGTCIDVGTGESGSSLTLAPCGDLAEQLIVFRSAGSGAYALFNPKSGLCIGADAPDGGTANGTPLTLQAWSETPAQSFTLKGSAGAYFLVAPGDFCVDDKGFGTASGTPVRLWGCTGGLNQEWAVVP
jgi:hypothetical protein